MCYFKVIDKIKVKRKHYEINKFLENMIEIINNNL